MGFFSNDNFDNDDASDALGFIGSVVLKRFVDGGKWTSPSEFTDLFFMFCEKKKAKPSFLRSNKLINASRGFVKELIADPLLFGEAERAYQSLDKEKIFDFDCALCIKANNFLIREGLIK